MLSNLKQVVTVGVNQFHFFVVVCFTCFSFIFQTSYLIIHVLSINNHTMKTECPIDMKQTALEREFHKLPFYAKKVLCPVPPGFARMPHNRVTFTKLACQKVNCSSTFEGTGAI